MSVRAFENWTPDSVPCPVCGLLLPATDAACPRCGRSVAHSAPPAASPSPPTTQAAAPPPYCEPSPSPATYVQYTPPPEAYLPPETYLPPAELAGAVVVRPARSGPRPALIAVVLALVLVLAGAGYGIHRLSSHGSAAASTGPTESALPSTHAPVGKLALSAIPVTPDELPGWQVSPPDSPDSSSDIESDKNLAKCMGVKYTARLSGATAEADYRLGPYLVTSQAQRMRHSDVAADVAMLDNPTFRSCFRKPLRREFGKAIPGARLSSARLKITRPAPGSPANVVGVISLQLVFEVNGQTRMMYLDSALIAGRRIESQLVFIGVDSPVDAQIQAQLVAAVAGRTAKAE